MLAFGAAVVALLWSAIVWDFSREKERLLANGISDTANLARLFDEHVSRTIAGLDQALLTLKAQYERDPRGFALGPSATGTLLMRNVSLQIGRIDPDGVLADSSLAEFRPVDLNDREHFRVHRDAHSAGLYISRPVVGRVSGRWSIQLTRRLDAPDGGFAGVLVLSMDPGYLADLYTSIDVGAQGRVILFGRDGLVRAASANYGMALGEAMGDPALVDQVFSAGSASRVLAGGLDDVPRVTSFRVVGALPLAVLVARSEAEILAPLNAVRSTYMLTGLVLTLVLGAAFLILATQARRQQAISHDLTVKKAELEDSRERLSRYVMDLERFAEVSAHDLQEPLRRVVSYAQLLAQHSETALDEEGLAYVAQVVAGAKRMHKLVRGLEDFVAVDHFPPVRNLVAADESVARAVHCLSGSIEEASATIIVDALPKVAADQDGLTEIFRHLLDNAVRYRAAGRRSLVHVAARREDKAAVFTVRDNGIGIDRRHWARAFEIFNRLHITDDQPGTGMGLAVARRIVERLGGKIWLESVPGEGSSFSFTLPLEIPHGLDQEAQAA